MPTPPASIRGADLIIYINNSPFATATGFRYQIEEGQRAIYGIDKNTPQELASGQCAIKGTIDVVRIRTEPGLEGIGIGIPEDKVLLKRYFTMSIIDRARDETILAIDEASAGSQSWQVNAKGELTGSFSFEGLTYVHELNS